MFFSCLLLLLSTAAFAFLLCKFHLLMLLITFNYNLAARLRCPTFVHSIPSNSLSADCHQILVGFIRLLCSQLLFKPGLKNASQCCYFSEFLAIIQLNWSLQSHAKTHKLTMRSSLTRSTHIALIFFLCVLLVFVRVKKLKTPKSLQQYF